jgi:hypothetical protein
MSLLKRLSDNSSESLAQALRRKRFAVFAELLATVSRPLRILDVGGTERFWHFMGFADEAGVEVTLLNIQRAELAADLPRGRTAFRHAVGDARDMSELRDGEFDVVFSNSVLEHVGGFDEQQRMMREVERVGKRYFVQTPNYYFPLEPHFHVLGFQFLPVAGRRFLLQHFNLGWTSRIPDRGEAESVVRSVRLLSAGELRQLCPRARLYRERFLGLTKSFIVYDGFSQGSPGSVQANGAAVDEEKKFAGRA